MDLVALLPGGEAKPGQPAHRGGAEIAGTEHEAMTAPKLEIEIGQRVGRQVEQGLHQFENFELELRAK